MTKLSKVLAVAIAAFVVIGLVSSAKAATSKSFTISVTVQFLKIDILTDDTTDPANTAFGTWAIAGTGLNSVYSMGDNQGIQIDWESTVALDITTRVSVNSANWNLSGTGGYDYGTDLADTYLLQARGNDTKSNYGGATGTVVSLTNAVQKVFDNIPVGSNSGTKFVYYQLSTPKDLSSVTKVNGGQDLQVEINVVPHS